MVGIWCFRLNGDRSDSVKPSQTKLTAPAWVRDTPTMAKREPYLGWVDVSVVVVVTGAGTVVCCVVVVEVWEPWSVPHPVTEIKATAATQVRTSFVICIFWLVTKSFKQLEFTQTIGRDPWGVTRPFTCQWEGVAATSRSYRAVNCRWVPFGWQPYWLTYVFWATCRCIVGALHRFTLAVGPFRLLPPVKPSQTKLR